MATSEWVGVRVVGEGRRRGFVQIPSAVVRRMSEVGPTAFGLYVLLRDMVRGSRATFGHERRDQGRIDAGELIARAKIVEISAVAGISENTVIAHLERLEAAGWVTIERLDRRVGNLYVLGRNGVFFVDRDPPRDREENAPSSPQNLRKNHLNSCDEFTSNFGAPLKGDQTEDQIEDHTEASEAPSVPSDEAKGSQIDLRSRGWSAPLSPSAPRRPRGEKEELVEDPEKPGRMIRDRELAHLTSARAKRLDGEGEEGEGEYTGPEAVALWRSMFVAYFDFEDPQTATPATFAASAKVYEARVAARHWGDGSSSRIFAYLRSSARLWRDKKPRDTFPSSAVPALLSLLRDDRAKGPTALWGQWLARRARR